MEPKIIHTFDHETEAGSTDHYEFRMVQVGGDTIIVVLKNNRPFRKIIISPEELQDINDMELYLPIESGLIEFCKGFESILINL